MEGSTLSPSSDRSVVGRLWFSGEEVRMAAINYCRQFQRPGGNELWLLEDDLRLESDGTVSDPAAWSDWLHCLWMLRGVQDNDLARWGRQHLTVAEGRVVEATVLNGADTQFVGYGSEADDELDSNLIYSERSGLDALRIFIDRATTSMREVSELESALIAAEAGDTLEHLAWAEALETVRHRSAEES